MKSVISKALAISALALIANQSIAGCATLAILGAPSIPKLENTQVEDVAALSIAMRNYVERAETKLEACRDNADSFEFNAAVAALEYKADKFNRIVRFYNRNAEKLAMN